MNDLKTSLAAFIQMVFVVDLGSRWLLDDIVEEIMGDFLECPEFTKRSVSRQLSRALVELFGENCKGQHRNRTYFKIKFKRESSNSGN